jgi:hypothetical protein
MIDVGMLNPLDSKVTEAAALKEVGPSNVVL